MLIVVCLILFAAILALVEVPPLWRRKLKKEAWVFSIFLLGGTFLSIAQTMHAVLPNPLLWINYVYTPISNIVFNQLLG
ncbi:hypothetical protein D7Z26_23890 [Cohnella endophytica]|uniref:Uncharacterized protein n=1 Tax=Cohnella endophytica TaxID=2419778 RepID=A0A494XBF1_9BACL|nr:hypothetical protein D7Z26_23890 [Cohnella endophytica]